MDEKQVDEKLHQLASFDAKNPFAENQKLTRNIVSTLDRCKILDPACGSGAFPMGVLQKMVHMLQKLDPDNLIWKEVQIQKVQEETSEVFKTIDDKAEREEKLKEINNAFDQRVNDPDYARKLYLIENCIYGVDIQPIATQISKLRFFISLVVDQKSNSKADENFGIRPLPNLETKFVTANTLICIEKPKINDQLSLYSTENLKNMENNLKKIRHKLFSAKSKDTKLKYRQMDYELRNAIAAELKLTGWLDDTADKLAKWDPYDQNVSSPFFDPEWMFDITEGFNIVIGNPPYLGQKGNKEIFQEIQKSYLGKLYHQRRMDLFYFFLHSAIINSIDLGIISFITTNYYLTATYSDKLRAHLEKETICLNFVNFNEFKVFESAAGQHNLISIFQKKGPKESICKIIQVQREGVATNKDLSQILNENSDLAQVNFKNNKILFEKGTNYIRLNDTSEKSDNGRINNILDNVRNQGVLLGDYFNVEQGIVSGADKVTDDIIRSYPELSLNKGDGIFILTNEEVERLELDEKTLNEYIKPTYKNSDIRKWWFEPPSELNVIYIKSYGTFPKYDYRIINHLDKYKLILINRNVRKGVITIKDYSDFVKGKIKISYIMNANSMKLGNYYCLSYARNDKATFENLKIINSRRAKANIFAIEDKNQYEQSDIVVTTLKEIKGNPFSINYLLCLLNSKLYYLWFYNYGKRKGETLELFQKPITEVRIKVPNQTQKYVLEVLSHLLIYQIKENFQFQSFETIIDALVCELYFSDHMKEKDINILQFVERDIEKVMQGREFEKLSDTEKKQVIEQLLQTWSHPDNEVRNRIKLFAVRSPEILKPILES